MTPERREKVLDHIRRNPSKSNSQVAKCFQGLRAADILALRDSLGASESQPSKPSIGTPVREIIRQFDELQKVRDVMRSIGKDRALEDDEMRTTAQVPLRTWNAVKAHPTLAQYRYKLPNQRFVWLHPDAQHALSQAINLSTT